MDAEDIRKLTNHYGDTQLLNLRTNSDSKGPYALRQKGYEPGSVTMKTQGFLLSKEGEWVGMRRWASLPDEDKKEFFFQTTQEALALMAKVSGEEVRANVTLPDGVSEKQADKNYLDTGNRLVRRLREARIERERRGEG